VPRAHSSADARQNKLLAVLPDLEWERLRRNLQPVFLPLGSTLYAPGIKLDYAYFPTTAIVSLEHMMADGASAEIAIVGCDGLVGIALFMGGESRPNRAVVQTEGWAYRLRGNLLKVEFMRGGPLQELLLRYTMALIAQTAQTCICNRHHSIDQQLCRWLLLSLDRSASSELTTTHEQIAQMLGVRREGVTEAAGVLQRARLIHYRRGRITVVDRAGLESRCCECYGVVKREFDRLLPTVTPPAAVATRPSSLLWGRSVESGQTHFSAGGLLSSL
jgi:CRP-like cAMP-binding protein